VSCASDGGWWLEVSGEPVSPPAAPDDAEGALGGSSTRDGVERALVAPSTALASRPSRPTTPALLADAYDEGVRALPDAFGSWAADVEGLRTPATSACASPADALGTPSAVESSARSWRRSSASTCRSSLHPGRRTDGRRPAWWPALTGYVASMHAAWHAWIAVGRAAHPRLRVLFAALAGSPPLHAERLAARGGRPTPRTTRSSSTTPSSYGPAAWPPCAQRSAPEPSSTAPTVPTAEPPPSTEREATVNAAAC
jgi:hypothetical protein